MRETDYKILTAQLEAISEASSYWLPVLSNASALLYQTLEDLNWAGFYLVRDDALILGPFQGKTACVNIARGKGVCGTAYDTDTIQRVEDVHQFPGHIACDSASNSEIVLPIHADGKVIAVLDIDSPILSRFTEKDEEGLKLFVQTLERIIDWKN